MNSESVATALGFDWAGWIRLDDDPFERLAGPFYFKERQGPLCGFRPDAQHLNGAGTVHGGCLATFADAALFALSQPHWLTSGGVTKILNCQFLRPVLAGQIVTARARDVQVVDDLITVSAVAGVDGTAVLGFTGIIKVLTPLK